MKDTLSITLCGMGGQGIILSAVILGTGAVTCENKYAIQTQSYGSEARGGQCQAELIISDKPINSPVAEKKDLVIAMFQEAYEKYIDTLSEDGILIYDPDLVTKLADRPCKKMYKIPATQIATNMGNRMVSNMVMLGFLNEKIKLMKNEALIETVRNNVPQKFVELNIMAVNEGINYAKTASEEV